MYIYVYIYTITYLLQTGEIKFAKRQEQQPKQHQQKHPLEAWALTKLGTDNI